MTVDYPWPDEYDEDGESDDDSDDAPPADRMEFPGHEGM